MASCMKFFSFFFYLTGMVLSFVAVFAAYWVASTDDHEVSSNGTVTLLDCRYM